MYWSLVFALVAFRIFLAFYLGISDDEAYYWDWSRSLAWSYYDHPGMVAWVIRPFTELFGHSIGVVRLPAILSNLFSAFFIFKLTEEMFGLRSAKLCLGLFLLVPVFSLGSLLIVPDAPMSFFWTASLYWGWKITRMPNPSLFHWISLTALLGLGFLSKYTAILLAGSLFLFFLFHKKRGFMTKGFPGGLLTFAFFTLPVFIWNFQHDWPSFKFHLVERQSSSGLSWNRWLQYLVSQLGFITPILFLLCLYVLFYASRRFRQEKWKYLFFTSAPTLLLFSLQPLKAAFKPHWPAPAYLPLFIGLSYLFYTWRKPTQKIVMSLVLVFFIPLNAIFFMETLYPIAPKLYSQISGKNDWNPRWDPTNDLYGKEEINQLVQQYPDHQIASWRLQVTSPWTFNSQTDVLRIGSLVKDHYQYLPKRHKLSPDKPILFVADNRYLRTPEQVNLKNCSDKKEKPVLRQGTLARTLYYWECPPQIL